MTEALIIKTGKEGLEPSDDGIKTRCLDRLATSQQIPERYPHNPNISSLRVVAAEYRGGKLVAELLVYRVRDILESPVRAEA